MSIKQQTVDLVDVARRLAFMLHTEELKIFGKDMGGRLEQRLDRLLVAGASVDPAVYKVAFLLKAGVPAHE